MQPSKKYIKQTHGKCIFIEVNCHQKGFLNIEYKEELEEASSNIRLKDFLQLSYLRAFL